MASAENGVAPTSGISSSENLSTVAVSPPSQALKDTSASDALASQDAIQTSFGMSSNESPDASKAGSEAGARPWPTGLPPLPPHLMGADLPIANISRIMKRALPDNGKIAKNAKECMQECVNELISFVTSEASDRCGSEKRKTINGDDILYSLRVLGFDNYEQVLKVYLSRYRQAQEDNPRQRRRRAMKRRSSPSSRTGSGDGDLSTTEGAVDDDAQEEDDDEDAASDEGGDEE